MAEEIKAEQERDFMLRNEMRKLKAEDIAKMRERNKRLGEKKKRSIMDKSIEQDLYNWHSKSQS